MASRPKASGKTIAFIQKGSSSGPAKKGGVKSFSGAPVLHETHRGERTISASGGAKRLFPPVYGSGKALGPVTKTKLKGKKGPGYNPSSADRTNSPNPF